MLFSVFTTFVVSAVFVLSNSRQVCGQSSDICDWVGSGLQQGAEEEAGAESRIVRPLYLRCGRGRVAWRYPRGALRVLLRPRLPRHFRGCVRVAPGWSGARLYLEGAGRLFPLFRPGEEGAGRRRCFGSRGGRAALYVEADPHPDVMRRDAVEFWYDLEPQEDLADDMEECRPCSDEEILKSYCTSEFVVQGTVSSLTHLETAQTSELSVRVTALPRDSPRKSWAGRKYVTLQRPLKCGTKSGTGEFVFFGRWSLGEPLVHCAPRLTHWKEVRRKALAEGSNQCQLD